MLTHYPIVGAMEPTVTKFLRNRTLRLCLVALSLSRLSSSQDLGLHLERARAALERHDFATAEREYRVILPMLARSAEIHSNLGVVLHLQGKYDLAEAQFRRAIELNPKLFVPNYFLGIQLFKTYRYEQAKSVLETAAAIDPAEKSTQSWLAATYIALGDHHRAIGLWRNMLRRDAKDLDALYSIGKTYIELMKRSVESLSAVSDSPYRTLVLLEVEDRGSEWNDFVKQRLTELVRLNPAMPGLRLELGKLVLAAGDLEEARRLFSEELTVDGWSYQARYGLAQIGLKLRDFQAFSDELKQAVSTRPEYFCPAPQLYVGFSSLNLEEGFRNTDSSLAREFLALQLGRENTFCTQLAAHQQELARAVPLRKSDIRALFREKRYEAVISFLGNDAKYVPTKPSNSLLLASAYFETGNIEAAVKVASCLDRIPGLEDTASYLLCRAYHRLALQSLAEIRRIAPDSALAHQLMGETLVVKKNYKGAIAEFRTALKQNPNDAELFFQLGLAHYYLMEFSEAFEAFEKSLGLDPFNAEAHYYIGEGLVYLGQSEKAIPSFKRTLVLNPSLSKAHAELGKAYLHIGMLREAAKELELASGTDVRGDLHHMLFVVYTKLGRQTEATAALEASKRLRERKISDDARRLRLSAR